MCCPGPHGEPFVTWRRSGLVAFPHWPVAGPLFSRAVNLWDVCGKGSESPLCGNVEPRHDWRSLPWVLEVVSAQNKARSPRLVWGLVLESFPPARMLMILFVIWGLQPAGAFSSFPSRPVA